MPASIFGWQLNKRLFGWLRFYWTRSLSPSCPECDRGVLTSVNDSEAVHDQASGQTLVHWGCADCGFAMLAPLDTGKVRDASARRRSERARAAFGELELRERTLLAQRMRAGSRAFFAASCVVLAGGFYHLASGSAVLVVANWLSVGTMFWVLGMKRSYRAWQVLTGTVFVEGAFWHWLKHEKWLT